MPPDGLYRDGLANARDKNPMACMETYEIGHPEEYSASGWVSQSLFCGREEGHEGPHVAYVYWSFPV